MKDEDKTKEQLICELLELRQRITELEASEIEHKRAEQGSSTEERKRMDKSLRGLIEIIHFTENVSAKIHRLLDDAEIYRTVKKEFAKSKRYTASIVLLTDDGSKLRIVATSLPPEKQKRGEKVAGLRLKGFKIDLNKSSIYSQVVREGKTVQANVRDIIGELFPPPLAYLISKTTGYEKRKSILTPLKRHGKIIGVFAMSSTDLAEYFIPSVRNLAQHISTGLELTDEHAERKQAEDRYQDLIEKEKDIIYTLNDKGNITFANPAVETVLGYKPKELVGKHFMALIPKEMQEKTGVDFHNLLKTGEITAETVLLDKKGQPHFVEYSSTAIKVGDKVAGTRGIVRDITKRKQAEEKLRESEEMAHALLNAPSDSAWLIEPNGTVVALNEMAARTLDKSPNEIVGTSVFCLFSPEVAARSKTQTDKVIRSGKPFRFEDKRGERWFYQSAYPVFDAQGNVVRLAIFTRDITEQRRAEEELKKHRHHLQELVEERTVELTEINEQLQRQIIEHKRLQNMLRESQKKYRTLTENINVGIYRNTVGPKGRFIEVNPAIVKMFGYNNREEFLSINVADLYQNPEDRAKFNEKMLRAGFVRSEELELKKRDGTLLIGSVSAVAVKDEKGKTKYYDGVIEDITERKRVEEALRESEEKYRRLFNSSSDAVFVWQITKDGYPSKFINVNNIACQKYGYTREEFLNLKPGELDVPKGFGIVPKFMKKLLSEKFILFELEHVTKTGQKLPVEINSHLFELAGKPTVISIVRDITERKQAEEQIRLYNEQLEELVERRTARIKELERERVESEKLTATGRMAARIAHEINNPLGGIKNSFLLIKDAIPDDHPYYRYVGLIEKEIERIARIVHQMFDLYRPDQETPGEFWIEEAIGDVITLLEVNCRESGIQVETDTRDASVLVSLPEALFRQVLYNLLMNAIEASSPEGVVRVEAVVADEVLTVTVSDQGSGIPEEMRSQIFEPFFTTKSRLSSGGLGLGLSISKGLVEAMRGSLDFESKPGQGTIFRITLPVKVLRKEV